MGTKISKVKVSDMPSYGVKIRQLRFERAMSAKELGKNVGKSGNAITAYERGSRIPSYDTIKVIATALDTDVSKICPSVKLYYKEVGRILEG